MGAAATTAATGAFAGSGDVAGAGAGAGLRGGAGGGELIDVFGTLRGVTPLMLLPALA